MVQSMGVQDEDVHSVGTTCNPNFPPGHQVDHRIEMTG